MAEEPKPDDPGADFASMLPFYQAVETYLDGADAVIAAGEKYLPKFAEEEDSEYKARKANAKFVSIFADIVSDLAEKPFARELGFSNEPSPDVQLLADDIDGMGNNMHVFAAGSFHAAVAAGLDFILVDKTPVAPGSTVAQELAAGARPYWVRIPASAMIAAYTAMVEGREQFVHVRFHEPALEREGFAEVLKHRVKVFERAPLGTGSYGPATYSVWEKTTVRNKETWEQIVQPTAIGIAAIPLVPVVLGKRKGSSWAQVAPLKPIVHLQGVHYVSETNLAFARTMTAAPMLVGTGITLPQRSVTIQQGDVTTTRLENEPIRVGAGRALISGPAPDGGPVGEWKFLEIAATSLKFLAEEIDRVEQQARELGRQPLKAQTGLTVISAARSGQKAASAVQAWALLFKDALELAWVYTTQWMGREEDVEISIHTDFDVSLETDKAPDFLLELRRNGDISREAIISEGKRRNYLSSDYDDADDLERLLSETEDDASADAMPPDPELTADAEDEETIAPGQ